MPAYKQKIKRAAPLRTKNSAYAQKRFSFSISFPGLCVVAVVLILTVSWSFIFGVIIGRGHNPEQKFSTISRFLPKTTPRELDKKTDRPLAPEDLTFMVELKQDHRQSLDEEKQEKNPGKDNSTENQAAENAPISKEDKKIAQPDVKEEKTLQSKKETTVALKDETVYDFVFQVASFKKAEQANALCEKLQKRGIKTLVSTVKQAKNASSWRHVQVLLRGPETEAEAIKNAFAQLKISDAQCVSKKPAGK